ncbi:Permease of the drug/metabolite transporter (DMT) superfamily [Sinorhizobium sojae CCBAU 05684]|uniref:Permease of the drug/metabolite transporter (DMT) superfamily n=1 Tax=Sinorhizobium sojae CCBAU 05684 TaxID=716928 RepID=A0A249PIF2_9HYPH|nr:DMT family transporter [Sinorhizobium sojae]ASY65099.1 Permease of the drug/metabolite transporter (DMT) superfamily [Sinorhizobium sojae CCBAU 05684]
MSNQLQGYLYLSLAMVLVGSTVIASKIIAAGLPPFTATALRFVIALPLFLFLLRATATPWPRLPKLDWLILLLQAGAGSVGYTTLLISGLKLTPAGDAGVIIGTLPVVSAAIAVIILGERPGRLVLMAAALAAVGVLAIVLQPDASGTHSLTGSALIFGAVVCEGLFILLGKRFNAEIPPLTLSTLMAGFGGAIAAPFALAELPSTRAATAPALAAVVYYALVPTVGGFLLWYAGLAKVSGTEASVFTALAPVSAVLLAAALLGEPIAANQMIGTGAVLMAALGLSLRAAKLPSVGHAKSDAVEPSTNL